MITTATKQIFARLLASGFDVIVDGLPSRPTRAPTDLAEPIGYVARTADPEGNSLELSFGQEAALAVGRPGER